MEGSKKPKFKSRVWMLTKDKVGVEKGVEPNYALPAKKSYIHAVDGKCSECGVQLIAEPPLTIIKDGTRRRVIVVRCPSCLGIIKQ
jgi:hypothetical protein